MKRFYSQEQPDELLLQPLQEQQQQAISQYIGMPKIIQEAGSNNPSVQKDAVAEAASQTWLPGALVYTSGTGASTVLNKCITAAALCYGMAAGPSIGTTTPAALLKPPNTLFGTNHFPFDVRDRIIEINIANDSASGATTGTANGVTWAGGGTNGVALAPGMFGRIVVPTSGTYVGIQFFDIGPTVPVSATKVATHLLELVALAPGFATTDNNPRVWCKVIQERIQG